MHNGQISTHQSQLNTKKLTDHVYVNTLIKNEGDFPIRAEYQDSRSLNILGVSADFKVALVRAKIPLDNVPIMLHQPSTYYLSFGLSDNADPASPHNVTEVLEPIEIPYHSYSKFTYNNLGFENERPIYYVSEFLDGLNVALATKWIEAKSNLNYDNALGEFSASRPPFFWYNPKSNLIEFVCPKRDAESPSGPAIPFYPTDRTGVKLLISTELHTLLNGFPSRYYGEEGNVTNGINLPYHLDFKFYPPVGEDPVLDAAEISQVVSGLQINGTSIDSFNNGYTQIAQEYSSVSAFRQFVKLLFTSSIHLHKEIFMRAGSGSKAESLEILTDLEFLDYTPPHQRLNAFNIPQGEWRYHDLKDEGPLNRFDLKIYIVYRNGQSYPLIIAPNEEFSAKWMFSRKNHNSLYQISHSDTIQ
jgi:hypothetical protein